MDRYMVLVVHLDPIISISWSTSDVEFIIDIEGTPTARCYRFTRDVRVSLALDTTNSAIYIERFLSPPEGHEIKTAVPSCHGR